VADHCFRSRDYVNLIVIDKQQQLQWLSMEDAVQHCASGASVWQWASNERGQEPDIVLAAAGDIPTLVVAAAWWRRKHVPDMKVLVVDVVDLMALFEPVAHPHGMDETSFVDRFGRDTQAVFAFHGYQRAIHQLMHGRPNPERFHVRGFNEEGTTTTPFDMVVRNGMSRYHLSMEALRRVPRMSERARALIGDLSGDADQARGVHSRAPRGHARGARLGVERHMSAEDRHWRQAYPFACCPTDTPPKGCRGRALMQTRFRGPRRRRRAQ
jgi:xylulose-5-phosphate/fructose-6-phosphate phosphoketolase